MLIACFSQLGWTPNDTFFAERNSRKQETLYFAFARTGLCIIPGQTHMILLSCDEDLLADGFTCQRMSEVTPSEETAPRSSGVEIAWRSAWRKICRISRPRTSQISISSLEGSRKTHEGGISSTKLLERFQCCQQRSVTWCWTS